MIVEKISKVDVYERVCTGTKDKIIYVTEDGKEYSEIEDAKKREAEILFEKDVVENERKFRAYYVSGGCRKQDILFFIYQGEFETRAFLKNYYESCIAYNCSIGSYSEIKVGEEAYSRVDIDEYGNVSDIYIYPVSDFIDAINYIGGR